MRFDEQEPDWELLASGTNHEDSRLRSAVSNWLTLGGTAAARRGRAARRLRRADAAAERKILAQFDKNGDKRLDRRRTQGRAGVAGDATLRRLRRARAEDRLATPRRPSRDGKLTPADVKSYPNGAGLRSDDDPDRLSAVRSNDWEQELAPSTTQTSMCRQPRPLTARPTRTSASTSAGCRPTSWCPEGRKRSLNLSFDFADGEAGVQRLQDAQPAQRQAIRAFCARCSTPRSPAHYVPTPKMNYMRVVINGESWGLYLNTAAVQQGLPARLFQVRRRARAGRRPAARAAGGINYLGDDSPHYKRFYEITSKGRSEGLGRSDQRVQGAQQTPPDKLEAALAPIFDIDGALKFLAVEVALVNTDGYWTRASDYSLYQDDKGVFTSSRTM